jgi:hypothetical protein
MSVTPVSICSNALLMLGDNPIASFNETGDRARLASNLWDSARDYVLRKHPWNCAIKRVILSPDVTAPAFDYAYQFTLPADWLRTLSVGYEGERPDYKLEASDTGQKLLMQENVCRLRYVFRNETPTTWDASLVFVMTRVMRSLFAYPITQSGSMEQLIEQVLRESLREARAIDGSEDEPYAMDDNPLMDARRSNGNFGVSRYREP